MKRLIATLGFLFVACSPSQGTVVGSPSPSPMPSASTDPTVVAKVDFSCRLPVVTNTFEGSAGLSFQGGFITFPAAELTEDAAGTMQSRPAEGDVATTATPVLYGDGVVPFYDRAQSRWVPARARQALADGSGYAYITWNSQTQIFTAHVVNVATGSSGAFKLPSGVNAEVADYGAAGVYIASVSALGGPGEGVWLLNPQSGAIRQLRQVHRLWAVRDGYAWVARFDARDKTVWAPSELAPANSLVRINIATGAETIWFYQAGVYPWLLALDSNGRPVISVGKTDHNEFHLLARPGEPGQLVYSGNLPELDYMQGDGDRLWFGGPEGIYLYRPGRGFQKVFAYGGSPGSGNRIEPAGFCR